MTAIEAILNLVFSVGGNITTDTGKVLIRAAAAKIRAGSLPVNHDLQRIHRNALRDATLFAACATAAEAGETMTFWQRFVEARAQGRLWQMPVHDVLNLPKNEPLKKWLAALMEAAKGAGAFAELPESIAEAGTQHFLENPGLTLKTAIEEGFERWLSAQRDVRALSVELMPTAFKIGWQNGFVTQDAKNRLSFFQAYCLFFREGIKHDTPGFRAAVATDLAQIKEEAGLTADAIRDLDEKISQLDPDALINGIVEKVEGFNKAAFESLAGQLVSARSELQKLGNHVNYLIGGIPVHKSKPLRIENELHILDARHRAIEYVGRDADIASGMDWIESPATVSVRVVCGRAGAGKTRFALELMAKVDRDFAGWNTGFIRDADLAKFDATRYATDFDWETPTLVVLDYAGAIGNPLIEFLCGIANIPGERKPPLRILLLEREAAGWLERIKERGSSGSDQNLRTLFDPPDPVPLTALPENELRMKIVEATWRRYHELHPDARPVDKNIKDLLLHGDMWRDPLYLMMATLVAATADQGWMRAFRMGRFDLAGHLATREANRLQRFAGNVDAQKKLFLHMAALVTLVQDMGRDQLVKAAEDEAAALKRSWPDGAADLADRLHTALGGADGGARRILPDIVGEAFILQRMEKPYLPCLLRSLTISETGTLATLVRIAQDSEENGVQLFRLLLDHFVGQKNLDALKRIYAAFPEYSTALSVFRVDLSRSIVEASDPHTDLPAHALHLNNYAVDLSEAGQRLKALQPARESRDLYRELADKTPKTFRPNLAKSLNTLAHMLSDYGQRVEALGNAQDSVDLYRKLAAETPDVFKLDMVRSVNTLANILGDLGRDKEALNYAREALKLYRELAEKEPAAFMPGLALSLSDFSNKLSNLEQREAALDPAQESVKICRELAARNSDAFSPVLALSLNNYSNKLSDLGQCKAALDPAQKAVDLYRKLAVNAPDTFKPKLAVSLGVLSRALAGMERHGEAADALHEGIWILREPFLKHPPEVFVLQMWELVRHYFASLEASQREPDMALLLPIVAVFEKLKTLEE